MEGGNDDGLLDLEDSCQSPKVNKKLKKGHNPNPDDLDGPRHEEIEIDDDKNPFEIQVILDVLFKKLSFEDVKKFRHVSSTWNEVGFKEICKRPQKPIKFYRVEEFEDDNRLDALIQLQRRHIEVFPGDHHRQLFSNFSFDMYHVMTPEVKFDHFFDNFSPKFVELFGDSDDNYDQEEVGNFCNFLVKISPNIQEIKYNFEIAFGKEDFIQELTSTSFPNLRKISYGCCSIDDMKDLLFYSLIGQKSPKLHHLKLDKITDELGSPEYMKEQFEQADLMSKLKILDLFDYNNQFNGEIIKVFTEFGQNGVLKLRKLKIEQEKCNRVKRFKEIYIPLIASQAETLKILEISGNNNTRPQQRTRVSFPSLQNLSILQIDYFSTFEACFKPINFTLQFPKLVELRTSDIETFLDKKLGQDGGSVKSVILFKNPLNEGYELNLEQLDQIFPNLEFFEMVYFNFYPIGPFSSQLRKVIHCELKDLYYLSKELLQDAKKVEIMVNCGNKLMSEDSYKDFLGGILMHEEGIDNSDLDNYYRQTYYQHFLDMISENYISLHLVSLTFIGYKISEDLKRDFRAIHHHCDFICTPFKSADNN